MGVMLGLVLIILIFAVVSTLLLTGKADENYGNSTKRNTTNLTLIYVVIIFIGLASLGIYIWRI
ncbi:hypothetical protein LIS77_02935 [Cytobacillus firmus]|jgi:heme/copper-type cytochrome/quinol oxidase subunit 2|uniref:hypothetical protein n=1 Tax=Bacillaceae TaxID=186817 RepID=UPI0013D59DF8|nr:MULTISPECIES: hypothetical protein [Bacillaceae]MBG9446047.1 hypothetical protein [Cytobacillus firmus]MBG9449161.1 hypothetical protein [Cytobacillus firmus]MBG9586345.1 hypothetical protein [Cytobacillus firmus]MBY6053145.1 hypothetical protein [Cytobacillus firmus]MCU1808075.1 hypothetical protein [Cytobacillus firmus]